MSFDIVVFECEDIGAEELLEKLAKFFQLDRMTYAGYEMHLDGRDTSRFDLVGTFCSPPPQYTVRRIDTELWVNYEGESILEGALKHEGVEFSKMTCRYTSKESARSAFNASKRKKQSTS